jgi:hypothetical protein
MTKESIEILKKERAKLHRTLKHEYDMKRIETIWYRMELINLLIVSYQGLRHPNSVKNLKHRARF